MIVVSVDSEVWACRCTCSNYRSRLDVFQTDLREETLGGEIRYFFDCAVCGAPSRVLSENISEKVKHVIMRRQ